MAWEQRRGRAYYYRKRRFGDKVVSEYVGKGPEVQQQLELKRVRNQTRKLTRLAKAQTRKEDAIDAYLDLLGRLLGNLASLPPTGAKPSKKKQKKEKNP